MCLDTQINSWVVIMPLGRQISVLSSYLLLIQPQTAHTLGFVKFPSTYFKCQLPCLCHFLDDLSPGPLPCSSPPEGLIFKFPLESQSWIFFVHHHPVFLIYWNLISWIPFSLSLFWLNKSPDSFLRNGNMKQYFWSFTSEKVYSAFPLNS